jgi:nucleoid-associated protein YgaU
MGVMDERSSRLFVGICLLVLLWIGTYWLYEPGGGKAGGNPSISFDPSDGSAPVQPTPEAARDPIPVRFEPVPPPAELDPGLRVVAPAVRKHTVRQGDTFESIARQYFGPEGSASVIARANPLKDPTRLKPGDVIIVPEDPDNIQGVVVRADGAPAEAPPPQTPPAVEYLVKPGDSLSRIAQSYYGSTRHADFIFRSNRDVLSSPDRLRVGQTLRLPPLPAEPANP